MIRVAKLSKTYRGASGAVHALREVDLDVARGEFFVLLGPSGSGKTTLLRSVAGLERPDGGEIEVGGHAAFSSERKLFVPAEERGVGMVFQSYAIWPHLTVFENVALPLTQGKKRLARERVRQRVADALKLVGMEEYAARPAPLLSGGQQQRVALARALAIDPEVLLMDEPLSNLDARLREEVRVKIKAVARELRVTVLYVTHDQVEAMTLADRIAVMADGRILQAGAPDELYRRPASPRVAEFFGAINWLRGEARGGVVETEIGALRLAVDGAAPGRIVVGVRPEDVKLSAARAEADNVLVGEVRSAVFTGGEFLYDIEVNGKLLLARAMSDREALKGTVFVHLPSARMALFREDPS